jgi:hypothetical protein
VPLHSALCPYARPRTILFLPGICAKPEREQLGVGGEDFGHGVLELPLGIDQPLHPLPLPPTWISETAGQVAGRVEL